MIFHKYKVPYVDIESFNLSENMLVTSCETDEHVDRWAEILNRDPGFGKWDSDRIRTELISTLVTPDSSTLIFDGDTLIGCSCLVDWDRRKRMAAGMYMILDPKYRGRKKLSYILTFRTLSYLHKADEYDSVLVTTDPERKSALLIYLRYGGKPIRDSLYSFVQWHRIEKRLRPTIKKLEARSAGV